METSKEAMLRAVAEALLNDRDQPTVGQVVKAMLEGAHEIQRLRSLIREVRETGCFQPVDLDGDDLERRLEAAFADETSSPQVPRHATAALVTGGTEQAAPAPIVARESDWKCTVCDRANAPEETHCVHCDWSRKTMVAGVLHERGCPNPDKSPCQCGALPFNQVVQPK